MNKQTKTITKRQRRTMLLHSDRGSIYGGEEYIQRLAALGVKRNMSRKADPWDNAVIESFFSTLHFELLSRGVSNDSRMRAARSPSGSTASTTRRGGTQTTAILGPIKYELRWQMRQELI